MTLLLLVLGLACTAAFARTPPTDQKVAPVESKIVIEISPLPKTDLLQQLEAIDAKIALIKDLSADFEQKKHTALLKEPLSSTGTVFVKGGNIRWNTHHPRASVLTMTPGEIRIFDPAEKVVEIFEASGDLHELSGSPLPRLQTLLPRFDITSLSPSVLGIENDTTNLGTQRFVGIELTPKTDELKSHIATVRVIIDTTIPSLVKMEITDADDDRTILTLSNIKTNTGLSDDQVTLAIPDGVRISRPMKPLAPAQAPLQAPAIDRGVK